MIAMGAGTNHWFHSDAIYRTFLALVLMCGCEGRNGGGWAHYVGQEKVRPLTGLQTLAFALDWVRPPRHMVADAWFYLAHRPVALRGRAARADGLAAGAGPVRRQARAPTWCARARLGWLPSFPSFDRDALDLVDEASEGRRRSRRATSSRSSATGRLRFACEDPDAPGKHPARAHGLAGEHARARRARATSTSCKHMLGTAEPGVRADEAPAGLRPREVAWRDGARGEARPADDDRLPYDVERALLGRRPARGDLVREGRPLVDRPAPVRPHLQRGDPAARGRRKHRLGRVHGRSPSEFSRAGRDAPRRPQRHRRRAARCTTRPTRWRSPTARCATGGPASASRCRERRCRS